MITRSGQGDEGKSHRESTRATYYERILRVMVHLQSRLDNPPSLDELAGVANFSSYHLHHIFRGMVGESIGQHIKRLRLERAALRLMHSDAPITTVALDSGYETHESFTRAFTAHFGCNPSEYRKRRESEKAMPNGERSSAILRESAGPIPEVRVERFPDRRIVFVRHIGPYHEAGKAWDAMMKWVGQHVCHEPGLILLGIAHDAPDVTPADKLRYDACVVVPDHIDGGGEVAIGQLPGGEHAILTHKGPYERLAESYAALFGRWVPQCGRELAHSPPFEVYRNSPFTTKPQDLLTDLCARLID